MILVTGSVTGSAATFAALQEECLAHCLRSRREPGCLEHRVHVDCEDPLRLFFYERWADVASLKDHLRTADLAGFVTTAKRLATIAERTFFYEAAVRARMSINPD